MNGQTSLTWPVVKVEIYLLYNLVAWEQGSYVNTVLKRYCLQKPLLVPCYVHIGFLFVNFYLLSKHQACWWFCRLQIYQDRANGNVECRNVLKHPE
jgi:hypothetical protein